ncbi:hypothetical protein ACJX0J_035722, partial [Zea mays]
VSSSLALATLCTAFVMLEMLFLPSLSTSLVIYLSFLFFLLIVRPFGTIYTIWMWLDDYVLLLFFGTTTRDGNQNREEQCLALTIGQTFELNVLHEQTYFLAKITT